MFYAHSTDRSDRADWQPLPDHLNGGANGAASRAGKFGARRAALLAGLTHDLGQYSLAFQARLDGARDRAGHATAGAREVVRAAAGTEFSHPMSELVAYAVAGHVRHGSPPPQHRAKPGCGTKPRIASMTIWISLLPQCFRTGWGHVTTPAESLRTWWARQGSNL
ncbi:CRISPR-associated endonuclease Cas3'' [Methylobacterium amylolyticum]|uniref:CRISPR-associated endonuclease Cas3'' n=1 Tax=Methylobacterium sp. NEAU 140 TaxID=3064945 RepID=UPI0035203554